MLSLSEHFQWACSFVAQKIFADSKKVLEAMHILNCVRNVENADKGVVSFTAFCLQNSHIRERFHEIIT